MHNLINGIKTDPYGRRHIMTLWDWDDFRSSDGLFPCAYETLWAVRDNYLDCTLVQRSSDYIVANHINKIQYVALQMMVAAECGLNVGRFSHFVNNLHIYDRHVEVAKALLKLPDPIEQPMLTFDKSVPFISATIENFSLLNYDPMLLDLKLELAV
jgi:thymidylate synthase